MSDKKRELSFEGDLTSDQVAAYLEKIAAGLRAGTLPIESGGERISLVAAGPIHVEVTAKVKKRQHKLEVELEWEIPPGGPLLIGD